MTYEDILGSTFGKYSPNGGAANAPIIVPIPVEPVDPPVPPEPPVPPTPTPTVDRNYLCFQNVEAVNNTITLEKQGEPTYQVTCEYTKDGENWTVMNLTADENGICDSIVLQPNEKVWLRGTGTWRIESIEGVHSQYYFQSTGLLDMSGNVLSIYDKTNFDTMTQMPNDYPMRFNKKYLSVGYSYLKVRNAELSFDKIVTVSQTQYTNNSAVVIWNMFTATATSQNTYLQKCKIHFDESITKSSSGSVRTAVFGNFFAECKNVNEIWLPDWTGTQQWNEVNFVKNVASTGTMYVPQGKTVIRSQNGCPSAWTLKYYDQTTGEIIENN